MSDLTDDQWVTIDELARKTGMTVRNIRAHQARGLLPPPDVRGRTGYYGPEHAARIELVKELQGDGFNLESIRKLIKGGPGDSRQVLQFARAVREPFEEEEPEIVAVNELAERFGGEAADPRLLELFLKLGIMRDLGEGRFEQRSPRLAEAGDELQRLGVSSERMIEVTKRLHRQVDGVARAFVELFIDEVWKPFDKAGRPEERWPEVRDALDSLRPLASDAMLAMFQLVMTERVDKAFGRQLERMAGR